VTLQELSSALIAIFEGERLQSYQDSGGVWSIGVGHTEGVYPGMSITHAQALTFFAQDEQALFALVAGKPILEASCLVSFGFNCGRGALHKVLMGLDTLENPIHTTDRHGATLDYLVRRRRLESALIAVSKQMNPQTS